MAPHGDDDHHYHPVDAVKAGVTGAMITGAAGLFAASIKNAMRVENVGASGVITRSGGIISTFSTRASAAPSPSARAQVDWSLLAACSGQRILLTCVASFV